MATADMPMTQEAVMSESQMKTLLKGSVHYEFIPQAKQSTKLIMWKY
jgi:hypothetical protein